MYPRPSLHACISIPAGQLDLRLGTSILYYFWLALALLKLPLLLRSNSNKSCSYSPFVTIVPLDGDSAFPSRQLSCTVVLDFDKLQPAVLFGSMEITTSSLPEITTVTQIHFNYEHRVIN